MNEGVLYEVSNIIEGFSISNTILLIYFCGALIAGGGIAGVAEGWQERRDWRLLLVVIGVVACACHFIVVPIVKYSLVEEARQVVDLAKSNRLVAEPVRDVGGNVVGGRVNLRESTVESLFGRETETSGWSKQISVEEARALSEYLKKTEQGSVSWNKGAGR